MPRTMLAKCAEAQALRKGFPEELSGIYVEEENATEIIDVTPRPSSTAIAKEMDREFGQIVNEPSPPTPPIPTLEDRRTLILGTLIGRGKRFGTKVQDAKKWIRDTAGADILALTAEQCDVIKRRW